MDVPWHCRRLRRVIRGLPSCSVSGGRQRELRPSVDLGDYIKVNVERHTGKYPLQTTCMAPWEE